MTFYIGKKVKFSILIEQLEVVLGTEIDSLLVRKESSPMFLMADMLEEGFPLMISINWKITYTPRLDNVDLAELMAKRFDTRVVTFLPDRLNPARNPHWYFAADEDGSSWKIKEDLALRNRDGLFLADATKVPL